METKTIQTAVQTAIAAVIIMATFATFATLTTTWAANRPHVYQCHTDTECEAEEREVNR